MPITERLDATFALTNVVAIDLYDDEGNHTGHAASSTANSPIYDEQIPNSYYLEFGEGKYLGMPGTEAHTVKLDGLAKGTFTLKLQEQVGDVTMKEVVFEDIPVTASTTGTIMLTSLTTPRPPTATPYPRPTGRGTSRRSLRHGTRTRSQYR